MVFDEIQDSKVWEEFLWQKEASLSLTPKEVARCRALIQNRCIPGNCEKIVRGETKGIYPVRHIISKTGSTKKRIVYTYPEAFNWILRLIADRMHAYDDLFCDNCYAFRKNRSAKTALWHLKDLTKIRDFWAAKLDVSNYFNSIPERRLLDCLLETIDDQPLYHLFETLLTEDTVWWNGKLVKEKKGAMAGVPVSSFFANLYLRDLDSQFGVEEYFRYSDDILLLADSEESLKEKMEKVISFLKEKELSLNPDKIQITSPQNPINFLGFSVEKGELELSKVAIVKLKNKARRKARALRRWAARKNLDTRKAAKGFCTAMNRKLFVEPGKDGFSWSRWYFPLLTKTDRLHELDLYLQDTLRYIITGKHRKGNYRIPYEALKEAGYRNLVHEYYRMKTGTGTITGIFGGVPGKGDGG